LPRDARERARRGPEPAASVELHGVHPVLEALRARRRTLLRLRVRRDLRRSELGRILAAARAAGVPIEEVGAEVLVAAAPPGVASQGVALLVGPLPEVPLGELARAGEAPRTLVALDGVEDPRNVGAITRVAEACGASGLLLTRRRAPPLGAVVSRASAGAIEWLPVARVPNLGRALNTLKEKGFWVFGCDPEGAEELFALPARVVAGDQVVVLGAEGRGLRAGILRVIDHRICIPMVGRVGSLNVATAAAVVLFELRRRRFP
jgi:23S rRNA (guanosine2251-2'-O)-methyltransferase